MVTLTDAPDTRPESPAASRPIEAEKRGALNLSDKVFVRVLGELLRRTSAVTAKPDVRVTTRAWESVEAHADVTLQLPEGRLEDALAGIRRAVAPEFERQTGRRLALLDLTVSEFDVDSRPRAHRVA